jgi:hypothetical protein
MFWEFPHLLGRDGMGARHQRTDRYAQESAPAVTVQVWPLALGTPPPSTASATSRIKLILNGARESAARPGAAALPRILPRAGCPAEAANTAALSLPGAAWMLPEQRPRAKAHVPRACSKRAEMVYERQRAVRRYLAGERQVPSRRLWRRARGGCARRGEARRDRQAPGGARGSGLAKPWPAAGSPSRVRASRSEFACRASSRVRACAGSRASTCQMVHLTTSTPQTIPAPAAAFCA